MALAYLRDTAQATAANIAAVSRDTRFLFLPAGLIGGMACYFALPVEPAVWVLPLVLLAVAAGWRMMPNLRFLFVIAGVIVGGMLVAQLHTSQAANHWGSLDLPSGGRDMTLTGRVDWAEPRPRGGLVDLHVVGEEKPYRVRLYTNRKLAATLLPGCMVEVKARLRPLAAPLTEGGYDPRFVAHFDGTRARGFVRDILDTDCTDTLTFRERLARFRLAVAARFIDTMPEPQGALAAALVVGVRGSIPAETRSIFRNSGLAHLLAISGLHMALFAGTAFAALRLLFACFPIFVQRYDARRIAAIVASFGAFSYLLVSGASFATQRAFVMIALAFLAISLGRHALTLRNVAWAALIVALWQPEAVTQAGFQMSFAAVLTLVSFYEATRNFGTEVGRIEHRRSVRAFLAMRRYMLVLFMTSLLAGGATGIISLVHFNRLALYGLTANLFAVPIFGFAVMPAASLTLFAMPFGLEAAPAAVINTSLEFIIAFADRLTQFEGAVVLVGASSGWVLPLAMSGLVILCFPLGRLRLVGAAMLLVAIAGIGRAPQPDAYILGRGYQIAARAPDGAWHVSSHKRGTYEAGVWLRRAGEVGYIKDVPLADCDESACRFTLPDGRVLISVRQIEALAEACDIADVVITRARAEAETCAAVLLDANTLAPYRITLLESNDGGVRIRRLNERGRRLWGSQYFRTSPTRRP